MCKPEEPKQLCYLTGPMTGVPGYRKVFYKAAKALGKRGYRVINPAELDGKTTPNWIDALRRDVSFVSQADVLAVMPNWNRSKGALIEVRVAVMLQIPIIDAATTVPIHIPEYLRHLK